MFALILVLLATPPESSPRPAGLAPELAPPVQVMADGKPIDVERSGHAAPYVGDFFGDGRPALLVGQFDGGKLRIYRNLGTAKSPRFGGFEWFKASEALGTIEPG
jgi:hypothetical protein